MKLIRKPIISAGVAIATDIIMLALAAVLNILRGRVPASYTFDPIEVLVIVSHPYDLFGILTAAALAIAAVMSAFIIAAAVTGSKSRAASRMVGAAVLLTVSVAAVLFAHFIVRGQTAEDYACHVFEDGNYKVAIQETKYSEHEGTVEVFLLTEAAHDHDAPDTSEHTHSYDVRLLAGSEIHTFSDSSDDYELVGDINENLVVRFMDGDSYRQFNIDMGADTTD